MTGTDQSSAGAEATPIASYGGESDNGSGNEDQAQATPTSDMSSGVSSGVSDTTGEPSATGDDSSAGPSQTFDPSEVWRFWLGGVAESAASENSQTAQSTGGSDGPSSTEGSSDGPSSTGGSSDGPSATPTSGDSSATDAASIVDARAYISALRPTGSSTPKSEAQGGFTTLP